jgi:hypothetical protein
MPQTNVVVSPTPTPTEKTAQTNKYPDEKALDLEEDVVKADEIKKWVIHALRLNGELTFLDLPCWKDVSSHLRPTALDLKSRASFVARSHLWQR